MVKVIDRMLLELINQSLYSSFNYYYLTLMLPLLYLSHGLFDINNSSSFIYSPSMQSNIYYSYTGYIVSIFLYKAIDLYHISIDLVNLHNTWDDLLDIY